MFRTRRPVALALHEGLVCPGTAIVDLDSHLPSWSPTPELQSSGSMAVSEKYAVSRVIRSADNMCSYGRVRTTVDRSYSSAGGLGLALGARIGLIEGAGRRL